MTRGKTTDQDLAARVTQLEREVRYLRSILDRWARMFAQMAAMAPSNTAAADRAMEAYSEKMRQRRAEEAASGKVRGRRRARSPAPTDGPTASS